MGLTVANIKVGTELTPLVKHMTLQKMIWFSSGEGTTKEPNLHTDAAAAERDTGMKKPFASGRMSLGYACELMSRFVGLDVFSAEPPGATALACHPHAVVTPHIGAQTAEAQVRAAEDIAHEVLAALNGKPLRWKVS